MVPLRDVKTYKEEAAASQTQLSLLDFLRFYNGNLPTSFPRASAALLKKFKEGHAMLFKHGELWSLDLHRKKIMDWLQINAEDPAR